MSVGLLFITHSSVGTAMVETAATMLNACPLQFDLITVGSNDDPDERLASAAALVEKLDQGDGVLILTDMYGSTPSNIACTLIQRYRVRTVAGINLPMLVRILNYPQLPLDELATRAASGGRDGIFVCPPDDDAFTTTSVLE